MDINATAIEAFLRKVDQDFPVPLSQKQDLGDLAQKFARAATLCVAASDTGITAMVAGYTENLANGMAYASVAAALPEERGKGLVSSLMREFMDICVSKGIPALHLYTASSNLPALAMYRKLGFEIWDCPGEPRPGDVHLIKHF